MSEWLDEMAGPVGTPQRDRFDRYCRQHSLAERIGWAVMRPLMMVPFIGRPVSLFWLSFFVFDGPRGCVDAMSSWYFGDFLFWGKPMTEDYFDHWVSRVHFPKWLRLR